MTRVTGIIEESEMEEILKSLPVEYLRPGRYQPRDTSNLDPKSLNEMAESIKSQGLVQPIVVRSIGSNSYEIIAGERRWRAAQIARLMEVPCIIRQLTDHEACKMSLTENIQREDLNPIEEARAFQVLIDEFGLTQQTAADESGKTRSHVGHILRLLKLPDDVQQLIVSKKLEYGHGRLLASDSLNEAQVRDLAIKVIKNSISVKQLGRHIKALSLPKRRQAPKDSNIETLERDLSEYFGTSVVVDYRKDKTGELRFKYHSLDELDGLLERMRPGHQI